MKLAIETFGGVGLLFASFMDSSFVPLPLITDVGLIDLSCRYPERMPYYAAMASFGSLAGCVWIYYLARKGGHAYYRRKRAGSSLRIRWLVSKYPWACVFFPAVAPFPVPFKPFVVALGIFEAPVIVFIVGTLAGRGCLFLFEGFLGLKYGAAAKQVMVTHRWGAAGIALLVVAVFFLMRWSVSVVSGKSDRSCRS
jgi:membrane protein YqaA with SNARE-associated domain